MLGEIGLRPRGPIHQLAPAIGTAIVKRLGTRCAKGAFERTDERPGRRGGQVGAATFTISAHFEHRAGLGGIAAERKWGVESKAAAVGKSVERQLSETCSRGARDPRLFRIFTVTYDRKIRLVRSFGTAIVKRLGTRCAKGAFERTDERPGRRGGQVGAATFTIRAHFEHRAGLGGIAAERKWGVESKAAAVGKSVERQPSKLARRVLGTREYSECSR